MKSGARQPTVSSATATATTRRPRSLITSSRLLMALCASPLDRIDTKLISTNWTIASAATIQKSQPPSAKRTVHAGVSPMPLLVGYAARTPPNADRSAAATNPSTAMARGTGSARPVRRCPQASRTANTMAGNQVAQHTPQMACTAGTLMRHAPPWARSPRSVKPLEQAHDTVELAHNPFEHVVVSGTGAGGHVIFVARRCCVGGGRRRRGRDHPKRSRRRAPRERKRGELPRGSWWTPGGARVARGSGTQRRQGGGCGGAENNERGGAHRPLWDRSLLAMQHTTVLE